MNWKKAIKIWLVTFGLTVIIGGSWEWLEQQEVELTLGSFRREEKQALAEPAEVPRMDFGRGCQFEVNEQLEMRSLNMVGQERQVKDVKRLKADAEITLVARNHARDMVALGYFAHQDTDGVDAGDRLSNLGISYELVGENLAFATGVEAAHRGLMKSESHRGNIEEPRFGRIGIGVLDGGRCGAVVVQNFAD